MEHKHSDKHNKNLGRAFKTGIAINIIFIAAETYFGFLFKLNGLNR